MELWDAYHSDGTLAQGTLVRGGENPLGLYHLVAEVLVRHRDGTYLVMTRHPQKTHGGMLEASAGGSVRKGEDSITGAKRELFEETGICTDSMTFFRRWTEPRHTMLFDYYQAETNVPKDSVRLQAKETVAYAWLSPEALKQAIREHNVVNWDYLQEMKL